MGSPRLSCSSSPRSSALWRAVEEAEALDRGMGLRTAYGTRKTVRYITHLPDSSSGTCILDLETAAAPATHTMLARTLRRSTVVPFAGDTLFLTPDLGQDRVPSLSAKMREGLSSSTLSAFRFVDVTRYLPHSTSNGTSGSFENLPFLRFVVFFGPPPVVSCLFVGVGSSLEPELSYSLWSTPALVTRCDFQRKPTFVELEQTVVEGEEVVFAIAPTF
ncbi:hypothetical protein BDM02DRAFT_2006361 [Thelephora ganbajun]|uniref:Uncharacterized protein n=1 Tax=Thelephora ganbajun TaxID=370292 RepID=A0ACB6ZHU2_THEGA|nr:hypothetical protein BDM02DRAFT_2006361 [Thelephora ganbajun]